MTIDHSRLPAGSLHRLSWSYEDLIAEALDTTFRGWDFSWLADRTYGEDLPWSNTDRARALLADATAVLDLDTGGGELLAGLAPLPAYAVATESWEPNVALARERLVPLGVDVRRKEGVRIPAGSDEFDLVLNTHGGFDAAELARVLRPSGRFLTQQVGSRNDVELNVALGAPPPKQPADAWTLEVAVAWLENGGLRVLQAREAAPAYVFGDIGAVAYHLRAVSWQIPGYSLERYDAQMRALDRRMRAEGGLVVHHDRFRVEAELPHSD